MIGNRVTFHSACDVFSQMKHLNAAFGVRGFLFDEDDFLVSRERTLAFCRLSEAAGSPFPWACLTRADRLDPFALRRMRAAGCWQIALGVESGSDKMLQGMRKAEDVAMMREAAQQAADAGMAVKGFFMLGFIGEDRRTLEETARFATSGLFDDVVVSFFTPFPGLTSCDHLVQSGTLIGSVEEMDLYTPVFVPKNLKEDDLWEAYTFIESHFSQSAAYPTPV